MQQKTKKIVLLQNVAHIRVAIMMAPRRCTYLVGALIIIPLLTTFGVLIWYTSTVMFAEFSKTVVTVKFILLI